MTRVKKKKKVETTVDRRRRLNRRLAIIKVFLGVFTLVLVYRISYFKFVKGETFERQVYERMTRTEKEIQALRGNIVDRNNKVVAASVLVYNIILEPVAILKESEEEQQRLYNTLAEVTKEGADKIKQLVEANPTSWYRILKKDISAETMEALKKEKLKGVWFEESFVRNYPKGELAAQILGFYNGTSGQYGVEQRYNDAMKGKNGRIFPKVQDGDIIITEVAPSQKGHTVVLTVDEVVQQYVENTMDKYVKEYGPIHASAIVMNPKTGEIYSMYSYPSYNPNQYGSLQEQLGEKTWQSLTQEQKTNKLNQAWKNFNIQYPYEPGSTLKPMIVALALEEGIISTEDQYQCTGNNNVAGQNIRCWKTGGHGIQTLEQGLANSCNSVMIQIIEKVSAPMLHRYLVEFGFGSMTGVDLPGEANGILHQPTQLGPVEKATASMGQGITLTPIQLMSAFAATINGGYLMTPYTVSEVLDEDGNILYANTPHLRRQVISRETSQILRQYLRKVVTEGTGVNANVVGYTIGGKTGTAQKLPREDKKHIVSFVGYAPVEDPEVMVMTLFDEIDEKSGAPTKAFNEMMQHILPYLGIEASGKDETITASTAVVPDLIGQHFHQGVQSLQASSLTYDTIGVGSRIVEQYPVAGTKLPQGASVKLYMETQEQDKIVQVPDLEGMSIEDARQLVKDDFIVEGEGSGKIVSQVPRASMKIEKGNKIIVQTLPDGS